jgi:hemolysin activation/secretion protein
LRIAWVLAGIVLLYSGALAAQDSASTPPDATAPKLAVEGRIVLYGLKGLRLVDTADKVQKDGYQRPGVTVDGPQILYSPGIYQQLQKFLGKPFSTATIQQVTKVVTDWYTKKNRPFVSVDFPDQNAANGIVQAVVTEYRLGRVRVTGNRWFWGWLTKSQISADPGDIIDTSVLNDDLTWINQNAYRQVKIVADRSQIDGVMDLTLQETDRFPFRFSAGFNNGGVPVIGRDQWNAGIEWANAFFVGTDLAYQFSSSDDFWLQPQNVPVGEGSASFEGHQLSWTIPLPWRDRLVFFGNYDELRPKLGPFFSQLGISWQTSARYVLELPALTNLTQEVQFGYDFKRSNNNLAFGGFSISKSATDVSQFPVTYNAAIQDSWGRTIIFDQFVYSPGDMTPGNTDAAFQPSATQTGVPFAHANYMYGDLDLTRVTRLPFEATSILKAQAQVANSNLLSSEELGAGGVESVRGYDERTASGSIGYLLSSEFRSPPFGVIDPLFGASTGDQLQFDTFWDYGHVRQHKDSAGTPNSQTLESVGAGFHYTLDRFVDLRFEYAWQLRKPPGAKTLGSEPYVSLVIGN